MTPQDALKELYRYCAYNQFWNLFCFLFLVAFRDLFRTSVEFFYLGCAILIMWNIIFIKVIARKYFKQK